MKKRNCSECKYFSVNEDNFSFCLLEDKEVSGKGIPHFCPKYKRS
jgi:hypothetical protein